MNSIGPDDDRDLRERFAELRRQDAAGTPNFPALLQAGVQRKRSRMGLKLAVAAACVLVIAVALAKFYPRPHEQPVPSLTEWRSPTDFLLQTPGRELLIGVPKLGQWPGDAAVPGPSPSPTGRKTI